MPILKPEQSEYPDNLLDDLLAEQTRTAELLNGEPLHDELLHEQPLDEPTANGDEDEDSRHWTALFTKARQEKSLARQLVAKQIPFYLPLIPQDRVVRGRRVQSQIPLFSGYLFLYGTVDERLVALKTNRICQALPVQDEAELVKDLLQVRRLIQIDAPLTVERRLAPGRRVRVKSGPMQGFEGTVLKRRSRVRLLVAVHFLQSGVSLEVDDCMLEPLD